MTSVRQASRGFGQVISQRRNEQGAQMHEHFVLVNRYQANSGDLVKKAGEQKKRQGKLEVSTQRSCPLVVIPAAGFVLVV